ncbi:MAG: hypothetical protein WCF85_00965 [Rhodospirillaceae bacterium]
MTGVIIVYGSDDARAALSAAKMIGCSVTLMSPPAAGAYGGGGWFRHLFESALADHSAVPARAVLDCADLAGVVLAALRAGIGDLRFTGRAETAARLAAIAVANGARLHGPDTFPQPWLDLRGCSDPVDACRDYLQTRGL